jgi:hypothetical protein
MNGYRTTLIKAVASSFVFVGVLTLGQQTSNPVPTPASLEILPIDGAGAGATPAALRGAPIYTRMTEITTISDLSRHDGDLLWGRIAGRSGDHAVARYVRQQFERIGLDDVRVDRIPIGHQWWPTKASFRLLGPDDESRDHEFTSLFLGDGSPATPPGGVEAELVWAGLGGEADLAGKNLSGKGVVVRMLMKPASFFSTARTLAPQLAEQGAAFLVVIVDGPDEGQFLLPGQRTSTIPVFTVSGPEGGLIEHAFALAAGGEFRARAELTLETNDEGLYTENVLGEVRGTGDEYVIITAHTDAFFEGANDNASGVATMLALAEHLEQLRPRALKNYLFVATASHHAEEFSPGSKDVLARYPEIMGKTLLVLNCEHPAPLLAQTWVNVARMRGGVPDGRHFANTESPKFVSVGPVNEELLRLFTRALERYGVTLEKQPWTSSAGDGLPFQAAGHHVAQIIDVNWWCHSTMDTPDTVSRVGLERAARAHADFLQDVDSMTLDELRSSAP